METYKAIPDFELKVDYSSLSDAEKIDFDILYSKARKSLHMGIANIKKSRDMFEIIERRYGGDVK